MPNFKTFQDLKITNMKKTCNFDRKSVNELNSRLSTTEERISVK